MSINNKFAFLTILKQSGVAALYVLLGLVDYHYFSSTFWPGSGLALSAVLIGGWRYLWSIFFGSLLLVTMLFPNGQIIFMGWYNEFFNAAPKGLFMFLPITWIAIRLDLRVMTFALNMIAVQALVGTYFKVGYFANVIADSNLYYYWIYVVTLSVVAMTLTITVNALKEKEYFHQKVEWELQILLDQERQYRIEQNNFMIMLAHELKTPLSTISMVLGAPVISENMLFHAKRAVSDMNNVVESCVQLERLSLEKVGVKTIDCTPIDMLNNLCHASNVPKRFIVTSATSTIINTDEQLFRTVLSNLIDNALKYSLRDSFIQIAVDAETMNDKKGISITIQNLIGVASYPDAEKVFQKYYRHEAAHHKTGSGLGLYLVKEMVQLLNGDVFYTHDTTSVTFKLWLPIYFHPV